MGETLRRSSLGALRAGSPVNLERAATVGSRLGGHLVQGHVDGVGPDHRPRAGRRWEVLRFSLPPELARYVVEKGSITVDGVSLTVMAVDDDSFSVGLIPTTLKLTVLGAKAVGDPVNLEVDVIAKYVEKMLGHGRSEAVVLHDIERAIKDIAAGRPVDRRRRRGPRERGRPDLRRRARHAGAARLHGPVHLRLHLRAADRGGGRPARPAAACSTPTRTGAARRTR